MITKLSTYRWRKAFVLSLVLSACTCATQPVASDAAQLIRNTQARRHGLVRKWFTHARLDPSRNKLDSVVLNGDNLFLMTSSGNLQSIDATTGKTLWSKRIGTPGYPSLGPAASETHVAMVNGSTVFVVDRQTGRETLRRRVSQGVAAAPAISEQFVFVPQFSGRIDAYGLQDKMPIPWFFTSAGRIFENAKAGQHSIIWATDKGHLYVADPEKQRVRFRFETTLPIDAAPTSHSGTIFVASQGGYVYAIDEENGRQTWRYSTGFTVSESPIALGDTVLIATEEPSLLCLDASNGHLLWTSRGVSQFISASPNHVYGLDKHRGFVVLDRKHGVVRSRAPNVGDYRAVINEQNDRLYLLSANGLIQCLHEIGLDEPAQHAPKTPPEEPEGDKPTRESPSTPADAGEPATEDPFTAGGDDPFAAGGEPMADDPFAEQPEGGGLEDDPFGAPTDEESDESDPFSEDPFGN